MIMGDPDGEWVHGIGFAISIDRARAAADELVTTGRVAHAYIGIGYTAVTPPPGVRIEPGLQGPKGASIIQVSPRGPGAVAGLLVRDIITQINGKDIVDPAELTQAIQQRKPGDILELTVLRGVNRITVDITLGVQPEPNLI